eukprot:4943885-Ditylum_brightwellii.AAC.1
MAARIDSKEVISWSNFWSYWKKNEKEDESEIVKVGPNVADLVDKAQNYVSQYQAQRNLANEKIWL